MIMASLPRFWQAAERGFADNLTFLVKKGKAPHSLSMSTQSNSEQVQSHKLLGVIIDTQLNFNEHIDNLCKKLTQRIAVLKKNQVSFTFRSTNSLLQMP